MINNQHSDEQLEAFIDDELNVSERARFMDAIANDDELAHRVCELLHTKDSVKLAYRESPRPSHSKPHCVKTLKFNNAAKAIAASLIFTLGTLTGLAIHSHDNDTHSKPKVNEVKSSPGMQEYKRVILHVSTSDQEQLGKALDDAELLLTSYNDNPELVQLEVVANTEGLALLRKDTSHHTNRIRVLAQKYQNVSFLACSRTIEKLRLKGIDVHLIPEATVIPGALEQIVDRLQQGWVYIRV